MVRVLRCLGRPIAILLAVELLRLTTFRSVDCSTDSSEAEGLLQSQAKDTDHLKEHLRDEFGLDEATAAKYLKENDANAQFFLMHDYDNNSKLDGLEILNSLSHHHHHEDEHAEDPAHKAQKQSQETLTNFVDLILSDQDADNDGYISYSEFIRFMNKQQQQQAEENQNQNQNQTQDKNQNQNQNQNKNPS